MYCTEKSIIYRIYVDVRIYSIHIRTYELIRDIEPCIIVECICVESDQNSVLGQVASETDRVR